MTTLCVLSQAER